MYRRFITTRSKLYKYCYVLNFIKVSFIMTLMESKVIDKLKELVSGIFDKKHGTVKSVQEQERGQVIDIVKDKRLARNILLVEAVDHMLSAAEMEVNVMFVNRILEHLAEQEADRSISKLVKNYRDEIEKCTKEVKKCEREILSINDEIKKLRHRKDTVVMAGETESMDEGMGDIFVPNFYAVAEHLAFILDAKICGDVKVLYAENIIAKKFCNNDVDIIRHLAQIGDEIYIKALSATDEVIWQDKEYADPYSVAMFENSVLHLGEKVCELYGSADKRIIKFPETEKEREKYI